jgi:hypothetical protein
MTSLLEFALAAAGTHVIKNDAAVNADKYVEIRDLQISANVAGSVTVSDGSKTYTIYVAPGINQKLCATLIFKAGANVTFTAVTSNVFIFGEYQLRT